MRFWVKSLLFISAYTPLFFILILKYLEFYRPLFWIFIVILIMINLIWIPVFKISEGWNPDTYKVKNWTNRTSEALDYLLGYIVAFLDYQFTSWTGLSIAIILLIVIFFVFINTNLVFINPLLNIFGYNILDLEVNKGDKIVLIAKRKTVMIDEEIEIRNITENIFIMR